MANLRLISAAEEKYVRSAQGKYATIGELINAGLVDSRFAGRITGYVYTVDASGSSYTALALPAFSNAARYAYFTTPDAAVRYVTAKRKECIQCYPEGLPGVPVQ